MKQTSTTEDILPASPEKLHKQNFKTNIDDDYPQFIKDLKDRNAEEVKAYILNKHKEKLRAD